MKRFMKDNKNKEERGVSRRGRKMEISSQSVLSQLLSSRELCSFLVSKGLKPQIQKQSFQSGDQDLSIAPHPMQVFPYLQAF